MTRKIATIVSWFLKILGALAAISAIIVLGIEVKSCNESSEDKEKAYMLSAKEHMPQIELDTAWVSNFALESFGQSIDYQPRDLNKQGKAGWLVLEAATGYRVKIALKYRIMNEESAVSLWFFIKPRASYDAVIRDYVMCDSLPPRYSGSVIDQPQFAPERIEQKPYIPFISEHWIKLDEGFSEDFYTVHVCLLYQNLLGNWYDLYTWLDIDVRNITGDNERLPELFDSLNKDLRDSIRFPFTHITSLRVNSSNHKVYTESEGKVIGKHIHSMSNTTNGG